MSSKSRQWPRPKTGAAFWNQLTPAQIPMVLERLRAVRQGPCFLCHAPATVTALFQPNTPEAWGGRPGKHRVFPYGLCATCMQGPAVDRMERVEVRLQHLMDLAHRRNWKEGHR